MKHKEKREAWRRIQTEIVRPALKHNEKIDELLVEVSDVAPIGGFYVLDGALDDLHHTPTIAQWDKDPRRLGKLQTRLRALDKRRGRYGARLYKAIEKEEYRLHKRLKQLENARHGLSMAFDTMGEILRGET